jgi:hypothetical protein
MAFTRAFVLASVLLATSGAGVCAEDRISTDRPDFLTSPNAVGKSRFQIETGVQVERDDADDTRTRTVSTPTLLRLGLTEKIELRLSSDGRMRTRETDLATQDTFHARGWADAALGVKWNTHEGNAKTGAPTIGWVFQVTLPTGSRAFRQSGARPAVLGAFEWALRDGVALAANAGLTYDKVDAEGRFVSGQLGAGLSKELSDRVIIAAEVFAQQIASRKYGGTVAVADLGVKYLVTDNVQLDALAGRGITSDSPKYLFTVGVSARF